MDLLQSWDQFVAHNCQDRISVNRENMRRHAEQYERSDDRENARPLDDRQRETKTGTVQRKIVIDAGDFRKRESAQPRDHRQRMVEIDREGETEEHKRDV